MADQATPALTGNPILDDPDSGNQTFAHPTNNPIISDPETGNNQTAATGNEQDGGIVNRSWKTILGGLTPPHMPGTDAPQPVFPDNTPIESPFLTALTHGARNTIDNMAEKLARGGEAILGNTAKSLPGYQSADDIRADINQRAKDYQTNPDNEADSAPAVIGRGVGTGLALAGPLGAAGRAAFSLLGMTGATAIPGVARALEYLGGGAKAAEGSGMVPALATRGASLATQGGALGGGTAAIESDPAKPLLPQVAEGTVGGAVAGPLVGGAAATAAYPVRAALGALPNMVDKSILPLADRFVNQYGIKLDPSQLTTNPTYRLMTDQMGKLPFSGAGNRIAQSRLQWQQALAGDMGETAPNGITHDVMQSAADRIGPGIGAIADRTTIQADDPFHADILNTAQEVPQFGLTDAQKTPIQAQFQNVLKAFSDGNGQISGKVYQNLTQTGGPLDSIIGSTDPTVSAFGMKIRNALDNAFQRSASPEDQAALQQLRGQYRVMKTIQPLVEQKGLTGDIEPNALLQRVRAQSARFDPSTGGLAYTGGGKLGDLAYGGQIFFGKPPDSGTAARNAIMGAIFGGGAATAATHPGTAAMTLLGLAGNRGLQSIIRSPAAGQAMITNSLAPHTAAIGQAGLPAGIPGLLGQ